MPPNTATPENLRLFTKEAWVKGQIPPVDNLTGILLDHMSMTMPKVS